MRTISEIVGGKIFQAIVLELVYVNTFISSDIYDDYNFVIFAHSSTIYIDQLFYEYKLLLLTDCSTMTIIFLKGAP